MKHIKETVDSKQVNIYICEVPHAPVVYASMYEESSEEILTECEKLKCHPFHFVSVTGLRWNEELSPWPCGQIVSKNDNFTGEADKYMQLLSGKIIPLAEQIIKDKCNSYSPNIDDIPDDAPVPERFIAGYSMGGLFALYAPHISDMFTGVISASGSVWFPDFVSYVKTNPFKKIPASIYLSIGDKESRTRNEYLSTTQRNMEELNTFYHKQNIKSVFELNPGNHFKDASYRMAKGIAWSLRHST